MVKIKRVLMVASVLFCLCAVVSAAPKAGRILSSFASGEDKVYGLDIRETPGGTELHLVGNGGIIYKYNIATVSGVKNGGMAAYDDKHAMMAANKVLCGGIAVIRSYEGAGVEYIGNMDKKDNVYRIRWGIEGKIGKMQWSYIGHMLAEGDCSSRSRTNVKPGIWAVKGTTLYKYPYPIHVNGSKASYDLGEKLQGVSLGGDNDLWILTAAGEILHVSSSDADILSRFPIDKKISSAWGIVYDPSEKSLWISSQADNNIYQISCP